jgi:hypothetical protein
VATLRSELGRLRAAVAKAARAEVPTAAQVGEDGKTVIKLQFLDGWRPAPPGMTLGDIPRGWPVKVYAGFDPENDI